MDKQAIDRLFVSLAARYQAGELSKESNVLAAAVEAPTPSELPTLPPSGSSERAALVALGRRALEAGQIGVVVLAGGMATRFNYDKPKGVGVDEGNLWGDYFYLEALARTLRPEWTDPW